MNSQPLTSQHRTATAVAGMTMAVPGGLIEVGCELEFHSCDPFAVGMAFSVEGSSPVEWVFARELLVDGLMVPVGQGDVRVYPAAADVIIELASPCGQAQLRADGDAVRSFVAEMLALVPRGEEFRFYDIDREISMLTGPEPASR